jgi:energy-coupling factor transporter ATP-binding protein EcfA2
VPKRREVENNGYTLTTKRVDYILSKLSPIPPEWIKEEDASNKEGEIEPILCTDYKKLITAWRKALLWTTGLDRALAVMLASIVSTKSVGDQLWVKIIGPPACGKSTLCEAISVARKYIYAKSTIRGFHSGFKTEGGEDNSLIPKIRDKTLVIKDGDTLLQAPNLSQILSEARDIYDRVGRTHYRNKVSNDYTNINMTLILSGTSSLRAIDSSELGERFLDCVIMEGIDDELEDEILLRVAHRANRNLSLESDGKPETQYDAELCEAMKLTGGYVVYLRENAADILAGVEIQEKELKECIILGKFVAYMRARPSKIQKETAERELAARLVSQHIRLGKCLAAVMNKTRLDSAVMERVTSVAMDTCRGQTLEIVGEIYKENSGLRALALATGYTEGQTRGMLRFLSRIGVVEKCIETTKEGVRKHPYWKLTNTLNSLYESIFLKRSNT